MANLGYLQLTRNCYQHCRFCSNPPTGVDLSVDEMKELIDGLADMDYDGVILTGGEPTLSPLLKPALEYAAEKGLYSRMITNGQLLADRDFFQEIVDRPEHITSPSTATVPRSTTSSRRIPTHGPHSWSASAMFQRWASRQTSTL